MRLPKDPENWTGIDAEACIDAARKLFERYEARVDFESPRETQDALYRPYQLARDLAVTVATYTNWCAGEARALP